MRRRGSGDKGEWSARLSSPCSRKAAAGFCLAGAVRGMRSGDRGSRRLLPALLVEDGVAWKFGLQAMWVAACGHRNRQLWPVPGAAALLDRIRAAVAYDDLPRSIALKLKYGRKVALARTMARYMVPLRGDWPETPSSFRCRCTAGGFGAAGSTSRPGRSGGWRRWGLPLMRHSAPGQVNSAAQGPQSYERRKAVSGAFRASSNISGRTVILIDDVLTSGSTAEACAQALRRAGAGQLS